MAIFPAWIRWGSDGCLRRCVYYVVVLRCLSIVDSNCCFNLLLDIRCFIKCLSIIDSNCCFNLLSTIDSYPNNVTLAWQNDNNDVFGSIMRLFGPLCRNSEVFKKSDKIINYDCFIALLILIFQILLKIWKFVITFFLYILECFVYFSLW